MFGIKSGLRYGWKKALLLILLSIFLVSGGALAAYLFSLYVRNCNALTGVNCIIQNGPLPTAYLAEILGLSCDQPVLSGGIDLKKGEERLLNTQIIREASIKKIKPGLLFIGYEVRQPYAYVGNYTNTALDEEGVLFPYLPFYPPLALPKIYLPHFPEQPWGKKIEAKQMALLTTLMHSFDPGEIEEIDITDFEAPTAGKRQLVLTLKKGTLLRLTPKNCVQELNHYFILVDKMGEKASIIDFRNPHIAYIADGK